MLSEMVWSRVFAAGGKGGGSQEAEGLTVGELSRFFFDRPFGLLVHAAGEVAVPDPASGLLEPVCVGPKKLSHHVLRLTDRLARPADAWSGGMA